MRYTLKYIKTFILSCNNIKMFVYFHIFDQINAAFGENKRLLTNFNILNGSVLNYYQIHNVRRYFKVHQGITMAHVKKYSITMVHSLNAIRVC